MKERTNTTFSLQLSGSHCKQEIVLIKDFANYKDEALEIYPTIVYACTAVQLYFDVIGYFGCLRVERSTLKP